MSHPHKPPSSPPQPHLPPPLVASISDTLAVPKNDAYANDDDDDEQQQLISNLLSSSSTPSSSSPSETASFHQVKFVSYPYFLPFESSSSSYITINGNEETCGSSFSDSDSSVMASFDTAAFHISDAFSGLFTPDEIHDFLARSDFTTFMPRGADPLAQSQDDDTVWGWSVFLGDD